MSDGTERVQDALRAQGVTGEIRTFGVALPTAAAAAEHLGCEAGAIANSLVFKAGDDIVLVLCSGAMRVDVGRVARLIGVGKKKVRRADTELVFKVTGQRVGGVAPVGHPAPLRTLVDRALANFEVVWAGAGNAHSMFATNAIELLALTGGELVDVAQAAPDVVDGVEG
ncbi:YbaK/EbsC family protein [Pseudonocardia alni]|uniref:YbaK/EbsC family protein n=1 Tax=Pseudonocardia alni TaxID=33907 RepID=UPI00280BE498|nr:YbaK/EbsC family protein [Pseudonocardia alni]